MPITSDSLPPEKQSPAFPLRWEPNASWSPHEYDLVANQFETDTTETISAVQVSVGEPWETVNMLAMQFSPKRIVGILPSFSQIEFRFHRAMRALGMPTCTYEEAQISVAASVVDELGVDAVIARASKLASIDSMIRQLTKSSITYYQGVLSVPEIPLQLDLPVLYEQHLVPGIVGLFQCEHLAKEAAGYMHFNDRFSWEIIDDTLRVTDTSKAPRFVGARLPRLCIVRDEICACGSKRAVKPI